MVIRSLEAGASIARYRVVSLLGAGGMGEVYLARDESLDRSVALKILPPDLVKNDERVRRFVQEAKSASSLNHPHIVTIYEIGDAEIGTGDGGAPEKIHFIAMELVSGHTLKTLIHQEKTDLKTLVRHLAQAADGLAKAHAAGIVHRDLKPENIMVTSDGFAKVVDFGLAKLTETTASGTEVTSAPTEPGRRTGAGLVLGTVGYMSPEQVQGKTVDHRSDIFSLGCVLYEAATRQRPFQADSDVETLHKILKEKPQPIEEVNREVPADLRKVIRRCLAKSPDQRWQSMKDLALELAEIADEYDTLTASSGSGTRVSSGVMGEPPASRRTRALVAAALVVGAIGLAVGGWGLGRAGGGSGDSGAPIESMQITRLLSSQDAGELSLSPDGRQLAYTKQQRGQFSLWIRQMATGSEIQLVPPQASLDRPVFSADGNYLSFTSVDDAKKNIVGVYQIPALGGVPRRLGAIAGAVSAPHVSPDGRRVAFTRMELSAPFTQHLIVADVSGTGERTLVSYPVGESVSPRSLAWSPDGETLAVATAVVTEDRRVATLKAVGVADGRVSAIGTTPWRDVADLEWSGNGRGLVMTAAPDAAGESQEPRQVWAITHPEGLARRVTNDADSYEDVRLSGDGKTLVTLQTRSRSTLWMAPAGNLGARQEVRGFGGADEGRLAAVAVGAAGSSMIVNLRGGTTNGLWTLGADGTSPARLTPDTLQATRPEVSLQARVIVFQGTQTGGAQHLWRMDLDGGNLRQITNGNGEFLRALTPDGSVLLSNLGEPTLLRMPAAGGEPTRLPDRVFLNGSYSPDGQRLLVRTRSVSGAGFTMSVVPVSGGPPLQEWDAPQGPGGFQWAPDGNAVDFVAEVDGVSNIWRMAIGSGARRQLTTLTDPSERSEITAFAWTTDGSRLFYSVREATRDVVRITNFRPDEKTP